MKANRIAKILLIIYIFFVIPAMLCSASSNINIFIEPDVNTIMADENFNLDLEIKSPEKVNISTFRLKISFDETKLKYTGVYSSYGSDDFNAYINGGNLTIIYLTNKKGIDISANSLTNFASFGFRAINKAEPGEITISAQIDGIGNYDVERIAANEISDATVTITADPAANCNLESLEAQGYEITPAFDPKITQYYTTVPAEVSSLEVEATPEDSAANVVVSRKKLSAAGKTTDIKITVTGSDKKSKKIYKLTVLRSEKINADSDEPDEVGDDDNNDDNADNDNNKNKSESSKSTNKSDSTSNSKNSSSSSNSKSSSSSSSSTISKNSSSNSSSSSSSTSNSSNSTATGQGQTSANINVVKNSFNFPLFFIVSSLCIGIAIFIIKKKY